MFDLSNLNDYEFEKLCKDIMQKELGKELFTFSRGVDAGVDICDSKKDPAIIIQAKHYTNSTYAQLKAALKKEVQKIQKLQPQEYFVCTSQELTRRNKLEIVELFSEFMPDISYVKDKIYIDSFLEKKENQDVVEKNYKLWLCASNVLSLINNQDVFIDCAELMIDIEDQIKLFVETQAYYDARNKLHKDNIIIIIGAPGVGKSTLSKMLLLYYANKGYKVRYVTNNNISEIKRSLNPSTSEKEIVLLDDFLGQHYLNLKDSQPDELSTLMSFVKKSNNKKLILNSRVTILNEAIQTYLNFRGIMIRYEKNKFLVDLDKMSSLEKAKILYNHLYFNDVPQKYLSEVKRDRGYLRIVNHENYNPRIIEYVTQKHNYRNVPYMDYFQYIIKKLDNPEDVWRDEFRNRLDKSDRILMNTLYSLSDTMIDSEVLEQAFNARIIREANCDTSINQYRETEIRLSDSLIKKIDDGKSIKVAVINPSVNDYLFSEIESNINEQIAIIDNAVFYEQIFRVLKSEAAKEFYKNKLCQGNFTTINTLKNNAFFYFLKSVVELHILDAILKNEVTDSLECMYKKMWYQDRKGYGQVLKELYFGDFYNFYDLKKVFLSAKKMFYILEPLTLDDANELINAIIDDYHISEDRKFVKVIKNRLIEKIDEKIREDLLGELMDIISNVIDKSDQEDIRDFINETTSFLEEAVWSEVKRLAYEKVENYIAKVPKTIDIRTTDFDIFYICCDLEISSSIADMLQEDNDDDDIIGYNIDKFDVSSIVEMFER